MLIVLDSANNTGGIPSQLFDVVGTYMTRIFLDLVLKLSIRWNH